MGIFGDTAGLRIDSSGGLVWAARNRPRARTKAAGLFALFVALGLCCGLAGCGGNFSGTDLLVDPGRYTVYKCEDLVARWKAVTAREKDLHGLMAKAEQTGGGVVVGSLAYRTELETVMGDERLLQRAAADKNCTLPYQGQGGQPQGAGYQSDQGIR
jgi:hypothetical protein